MRVWRLGRERESAMGGEVDGVDGVEGRPRGRMARRRNVPARRRVARRERRRDVVYKAEGWGAIAEVIW